MNDELELALNEIAQLQEWVNDLQSGMYINCVYCGHRYGPEDRVPVSMADILKQHIEQCPKHPMSKLKKENETLCKQLEAATKGIMTAIGYGNRLDIYKVLNNTLAELERIRGEDAH